MKNNIGKVKLFRILSIILFCQMAIFCRAQELQLKGSATSIISSLAIVPEGKTMVFTSGLTASAVNASLPEADYAKYGDTKTQAINILEKFKAMLAEEGMHLGQSFSMKVYVAKDPVKRIFDFKGWNEAYSMFFGTAENPTKPVRATVGIAELVNPNKLIEIELILAK